MQLCAQYISVFVSLSYSLSSSLCLCRSNNAIFGFRPAQNCSVCFWVCSSIVWQTQTFKLKTFEFKFDSNESFLGSERSVCIEHHDAIQRLHCSFSNEYSNEAILFVFSFIVLPDNAICRPYSSSTQLVRFAGPPSCNSIPSRRREQRQKQNICQSRSIFGRTHFHALWQNALQSAFMTCYRPHRMCQTVRLSLSYSTFHTYSRTFACRCSRHLFSSRILFVRRAHYRNI